MSRPVKILLVVILVMFPPALFVPALPIFGMLYLWALQDLPPEESAMVAGVYTVPIYLVAVIIFAVWYSRRRKAILAQGPHAAQPPAQMQSISEQDDKKRRKQRRQAEAAGDLLLTLAYIDADKKRK